MIAAIIVTTFDCHDTQRLANFWAVALGYVIDERKGPDCFEISHPAGVGHGLQFIKVPENKAVKNRLHLDLLAAGSIAREVDRLIAAGATAVEQHEHPPGFVEPWEWTVLLDPEGNEFCVGLPLSRS
jgi:hypothetical protein